MSYKVDSTDRAIVDLLIKDGRMSSAEIARRVSGLSERSARYRVDRLVKEGIIRVSAIACPKAVGLPATADVFIEVEPGRICGKSDRQSARRPQDGDDVGSHDSQRRVPI